MKISCLLCHHVCRYFSLVQKQLFCWLINHLYAALNNKTVQPYRKSKCFMTSEARPSLNNCLYAMLLSTHPVAPSKNILLIAVHCNFKCFCQSGMAKNPLQSIKIGKIKKICTYPPKIYFHYIFCGIFLFKIS